MSGSRYEKKLFKRLSGGVFFCFALLFAVSGTLAVCEEFVVERGSRDVEISVKSGEEFRIHLEGRGWYLNRYDRDGLLFRSRMVGQSKTSFVILPKKKGSFYLLFSYLENDSYVKVIVDGEGLSEEAPAENEAKKREEAIPVETSRSEQEKPAGEKQAGPPATTQETPSIRGAPESEIFYTDSDNRVVSVPVKNEDDPYRSGVKLHEKRRYKEAAERFTEYLESCKSCRYGIEASMRLSEVLIADKRGKEALQHLDRVIESGSSKYMKSALLHRGDIYYHEGRLRDALESYKGCLKIGASDPKLLRRIGDIHFDLNEYREALDHYERLQQSDVFDDVVLFRIATIYDSPGEPRDVEKAYRYYKRLVESFEDSRFVSFARGRIEFLEENFFNYR